MKILKIELQNINSLKAASPIVIDFESDVFRDVGLFAITGSTGAGKTTILDAITIALYHSVPRFNGTKAKLEDVVSFGADEAFVNITFQANKVVYEAHWSMRLTKKSGEKLSNPIESVRLKNLTTEEIISDKKTEVKLQVEEITKLNYNQFLRSVMLAQGEFAAFLSAKPSEKGELLEQITGEEIYKKIGIQTSLRIAAEKNAYNTIRARLNEDDILTDEEFEKLTVEKERVEIEKKNVSQEIEEINDVMLWYQSNQKLLREQDVLTQRIKSVAHKEEMHQAQLEKLKRHLATLPFKEDINTLKRITEEKITHSNRLKEIAESLTKDEAKLKVLNKEVTGLKTQEETQMVVHEAWMQKLQVVAELDVKLNAEQENLSKQNQLQNELKSELEKDKKELAKLQNQKLVKEELQREIDAFLEGNKQIPKIEIEFESWADRLKQRLTLLQNKEQYEKEIADRKKEIIELKQRVKLKNEESAPLLQKQKIKTQSSIDLKAEIDKFDFRSLTEKKDALTEKANQLKVALTIEEEYHSLSKRLITHQKNKKVATTSQIDLEDKWGDAVKQLKQAEIALSDAEKVLALEQKIIRLEEERNNLVEGEPCHLCGSITHPFVENYHQLESEETFKLVQERKIILEDNKKQVNALQTKKEVNQAELKHLSNTIRETETNSTALVAKFKGLNLNITVIDGELIQEDYKKTTNELEGITRQLEQIQSWQKELQGIFTSLTKQGDEIELIKTTIASLTESIKGNEKELVKNQAELDLVQFKLEELVADLKNRLTEYHYELPTQENTHTFLNQLKKQISSYNDQSKEGDKLAHEIKSISKEIESTTKQVLDIAARLTKTNGEVEMMLKKHKQLVKERVGILDLTVNPKDKREELIGQLRLLRDKKEEKEKDLGAIENSTKILKSKQESLSTESAEKMLQINSLTVKVELALKTSQFQTINDLKDAMLDDVEFEAFNVLHKELEKSKLEIETLSIRLKDEAFSLNAKKNFETTEEIAKANFTALKKKEEDYLKRVGEIQQKFAKDNQIKERNSAIMEELTKQENVIRKWEQLFALLGGSKAAFNTYVQRLTLTNLIAFANVHLYKLNKRYSLKMKEDFKDNEELVFELVDHYQSDQQRLVDTSSGGEKFLISLSLALGLSDLASHNVEIQSLFIDEGFGTLDNNTLETVVSTLETLQAHGKMIGIISHVENLKERIPVQVKVLKKRNGQSIIEVA